MVETRMTTKRPVSARSSPRSFTRNDLAMAKPASFSVPGRDACCLSGGHRSTRRAGEKRRERSQQQVHSAIGEGESGGRKARRGIIPKGHSHMTSAENISPKVDYRLRDHDGDTEEGV